MKVLILLILIFNVYTCERDIPEPEKYEKELIDTCK